MNARLKKIDEQGQILDSLLNAGRITREQYTARLRKLVERAAKILAK